MFISSKVALQFLKHSKLQTFVIILGIAVGVSVQIFIGLLSSGLENTILDKIAGNSAQVTVYSNNGSIENWSNIKNKVIKEDKNVKAAAPVVDSQVFIKLKDTNQPVQIRGFMPEDVNSLYNIKGNIYEGKMYENSGQVIIGKDLKKKPISILSSGCLLQLRKENGTNTNPIP